MSELERRKKIIGSNISKKKNENQLLKNYSAIGSRPILCTEVISLLLNPSSLNSEIFWMSVVKAEMSDMNHILNGFDEDTKTNIQQAIKEKHKKTLLDCLLLFHGVSPNKYLKTDKRTIQQAHNDYDESYLLELTTGLYVSEVYQSTNRLSGLTSLIKNFNSPNNQQEENFMEKTAKRLTLSYPEGFLESIIESLETIKKILAARRVLEKENYNEITNKTYRDMVSIDDPKVESLYDPDKNRHEISIHDLASIALISNSITIRNDVNKGKTKCVLRHSRDNKKNYFKVDSAIKWLSSDRKYLDEAHFKLLSIQELPEEPIKLEELFAD